MISICTRLDAWVAFKGAAGGTRMVTAACWHEQRLMKRRKMTGGVSTVARAMDIMLKVAFSLRLRRKWLSLNSDVNLAGVLDELTGV